MSILSSIPLFLLVLGSYFIMPMPLDTTILTLDMSGVEFKLDFGYGYIIFAVIILFIEIIKNVLKGVNTNSIEAMFSLFVAIAFLVTFMNVDMAKTQTFFVLMLLSFIDAIGGFMVSIAMARRDISFGGE